jgi:outer membrane receptor protein involved in Fe transport
MLAALELPAGPALAQAAPAAPTNPPAVQKLDSVEVTRKVDPRIESTVARIVINQDEILRYGDTTLADVLKRLPGITVVNVPGQGADIRMRGLGNGYTQILIDGEPAPRGFSIDSLALDTIERIEIQRAPTADVSARAIAGTINIVLRKTARKPQRDMKLTVQTEHGRPAYALDGSVADRAGPVYYSVGANFNREVHDHPELDEQVVTDSAGRTTQSWVTRQTRTPTVTAFTLTPRVSWSPGDGDSLSVDVLARAQQTRDTFAERTDTLIGAPPQFASDVSPFSIDNQFVRARVAWKHRGQDGSSLDASGGVDYFHNYSDARLQGYDADDVFTLDRTVLSSLTNRAFVTKGKYLTPLVADHAIAFGWDAELDTRREYRRQHDITFDGLPPYDLDETYVVRVSRLAAFAQDEWDITPRWSAYAGLRWETIDTRVTGNVIDPAHNSSGVLSPILQTLWRLPGSEQDQVRFSVARTYRAPTGALLTPRRYIAINNTVTTPDLQGNPNLRPELSWGLDAAYEHHWGDDGLFSLSAFARRIDDVILQQLVNLDGTWVLTPMNSGKASVYGIEAEVKFDLRSVWPGAPNVKLRANAARNWSTVDDVPGPNNRLERQTPASGNVGVDYVAAGMPLTLGANFGIRTAGPVRLADNRDEWASVRRSLEAYALWKLDARTQLRLVAANLLHQDNDAVVRYFDAVSTTQLTTTAPTYMAWRLTIERSF